MRATIMPAKSLALAPSVPSSINVHVRPETQIAAHVQLATGTGVLRIGSNVTVFLSSAEQVDALHAAVTELQRTMGLASSLKGE